MSSLVDKLYQLMDKGPLRVLALLMALLMAGCVMWDPTRFALLHAPARWKCGKARCWYGPFVPV